MPLVPEDNQKNLPSDNKDKSEYENSSNPELTDATGESDSSDNDDDSEDNFGSTSGYSILPQEPEDYDTFSYDEDIYPIRYGNQYTSVTPAEAGALASTLSASNERHSTFCAKFSDGKIPSYMQVPEMPRDKEEHLWNQQRQETSKLTLDQVQESKILKAMSGFSLPAENIPSWATNDQWCQQVQNLIGRTSDRGRHSASVSTTTPSVSSVLFPDPSATSNDQDANFTNAVTIVTLDKINGICV